MRISKFPAKAQRREEGKFLPSPAQVLSLRLAEALPLPPAEVLPLRLCVFAGLLLLLLLVQSAAAQTPKEPERKHLLNGLRLLIPPQPGSPELLVKLRINSGAASPRPNWA